MEFESHNADDVSKNLGDFVDSNSCRGQVESKQLVAHDSKSEKIKLCDKNDNNGVALSNFCYMTDLPQALISEILNCLEPKELGMISCVSTTLQRIAYDHHVWKEFYFERWGLPSITTLDSEEGLSWKELYVARDFRSKKFMGRFSIDVLYGHTEAVRCVCVLASVKLMFTSGYDCTVRMWNMEEGSSIGSSRPLGCTIRAVAADTRLLVVGGTDGFIHFWRAVEGLPYLFDLNEDNTEFRIWGHEGPITCLGLDQTKIYSGSWDMTVRVWDRNEFKCLQVLMHNDWVYSLVPHDTTVATTSGSDLYVWDTDSGTQIVARGNVHMGNAYCLARSHTGNLIFTGGEDGVIRMFEMRRHGDVLQLVATWIPHNGPVYSLAFEFPWLVSSSSDGKMSLIDVRKLIKTCKLSLRKNASSSSSSLSRAERADQVEPPQRMLHGFGCNLFAVDIGSDRIVCGGEEGVVRIWNFSQALEAENRVRVLRGIRLENRMRRRRLQNEMNSKSCRADQCSAAAKKNPINADKNNVWHNKRGVTCKLKA